MGKHYINSKFLKVSGVLGEFIKLDEGVWADTETGELVDIIEVNEWGTYKIADEIREDIGKNETTYFIANQGEGHSLKQVVMYVGRINGANNPIQNLNVLDTLIIRVDEDQTFSYDQRCTDVIVDRPVSRWYLYNEMIDFWIISKSDYEKMILEFEKRRKSNSSHEYTGNLNNLLKYEKR